MKRVKKVNANCHYNTHVNVCKRSLMTLTCELEWQLHGHSTS